MPCFDKFIVLALPCFCCPSQRPAAAVAVVGITALLLLVLLPLLPSAVLPCVQQTATGVQCSRASPTKCGGLGEQSCTQQRPGMLWSYFTKSDSRNGAQMSCCVPLLVSKVSTIGCITPDLPAGVIPRGDYTPPGGLVAAGHCVTKVTASPRTGRDGVRCTAGLLLPLRLAGPA